MSKKELEERIRLVEYENQILKHELTEINKHLKIIIAPMRPFDRIEIHSMGCSWGLPGYNELKAKYRNAVHN